MDRQRLLVVSHSQTGGTAALVAAFVAGASDELIDGIEVVERDALEATPDDVVAASAIVLATPENFGYMSGALKHFFDTAYKPLLDQTRGHPYALFVKGDTDTDGAVAAVQKIVKGLEWREAQPPLTVVGDLTDDQRAACTELGQTMAAGLAMGIF